MLGPAQIVCKFHQYGHCKFSETCKHFHTKNTCENEKCDKTGCSARHPRMCKYFQKFRQCKFGTGCSYLHVNNSPSSDTSNTVQVMQEELKHIKCSLISKEIEINDLKERVNQLEKIVESRDTPPHESSFKCDICDYCCKSETVLKRHNTRKHKTETLRESFGHEDQSKSLTLSPIAEKRYDCHGSEKNSIMLKCELCEENCTNKEDFKDHLRTIHNCKEHCGYCNECVDCVLNDLPASAWTLTTFPCCMCNYVVTDIDIFKHHIRETHESRETCDVCKECVSCTVSQAMKEDFSLTVDSIRISPNNFT